MDRDPDSQKIQTGFPGWTLIPGIELVLVLALFIVLLPGMWGAVLLARGQLLSGAVITCIWAVLFGFLALELHRRKRVNIWISAPSAILVFLMVAVAFYSP